MAYPPDKAETLLRKWRDVNTVLAITISGTRFSFVGGGTVVEVDFKFGVKLALLTVKLPSGEVTAAPGEFTIMFRDGASFEYVESSEVMFASILTVRVPNTKTPDFDLTLSEIRNQPDTVGETTVN